MSEPNIAQDLIRILDLEQIDVNLFRGEHETVVHSRLFGGQVPARSLAAADKTVPQDRLCHSLHGYFLRPGRSDIAVVYRVERIRDGQSFTTRRIVAIQNGEAIFSMDASFQMLETGLEHQINLGDIPDPDDLEDDAAVARRAGNSASHRDTRERPFDLRSVNQNIQTQKNLLENPIWMRFKQQVPPGHQLQRHLLAYASDISFVSTALIPHHHKVHRANIQMASLDHALWFHHEFDICDWFVYVKSSTNAGMARGYNRGSFYTRDGKLIASSMQEGLMRLRQQTVNQEADPAV